MKMRGEPTRRLKKIFSERLPYTHALKGEEIKRFCCTLNSFKIMENKQTKIEQIKENCQRRYIKSDGVMCEKNDICPKCLNKIKRLEEEQEKDKLTYTEKKFDKLDILKDKILKEYLEIYKKEHLTDEELKMYFTIFLNGINQELNYRLKNW